MADVQEIIVKYVNEVDEAVAQLNKYAKEQDKVIEGEKEQAQSAKKADVTLKQASEQRLANLKKEEAELKRLTAARKKAFTVEDISRYNKQISETQSRIATLRGETSAFGKTASNIFAGIGAGIVAAFSVQAIQAFASQSIDAFLEAESNAERLRFAITTIGGESEAAFDRLIKQSAELQKITVFSGDSIQQAQASLSAFGLTADQIEQLIPKLADFATITGQDIPSAAAQIGGALEGNGREFKKYGIEVDAASTRTENLNAVMAGLVQFQGAAAEATKTLSGQLKQQANEIGDLEKQIGGGLAPAWVAVKKATYEALLGLLGYNKAQKQIDDQRIEDIADNFTNAAERIRKANGDVTAEFTKRKEAIERSNEALLKSNQELEKGLNRLGFEKQKQLDRKQIDRNNEIIESNKTKLKEIINVINDEANRKIKAEQDKQKAVERTLLVDDLRKKSAEELIKLTEKENEIQDDFTRNNLKNIKLVQKEQEEIIKAREKAADELKKNQKLLADLQVQNIEDEKQRRIAAFEQEKKDLTAQGQLRVDIITELEKKLVKDLNEIDKKRDFDPLFRVPERKPEQNVVLTPEMQTEVKSLLALGRTEAEAIAEVLDNARKAAQSPLEGIKVTWLEANQAILQSSLELFGELTNLFNTFANKRIDQITQEKDAEIQAIDAKIEANKIALENRDISVKTEKELNDKLEADKVAAQKKADKEIRKIRRAQAILDKAAALFQIALNTAIALSSPANLAPIPGALTPFILALAGLQSATVIASAIPAFEKGTKGKKGSGLAIVGEKGAELTYLPNGSKVLPANKTRSNARVIDAMFDGKLDSYIQKHYVMPALLGQKKAYEAYKQAEVIKAQNEQTIINNIGTRQKFPDGFVINNTDQLARAIANEIRTDPYRR